MLSIFDINNIFFTVLGYPMSYIEFFGTLLNIWCVYLISRNKILNWPVGILAVILFMMLFYQIQLYSDFFEQIYFLITGFYGWWVWSKRKGKKGDQVALDKQVRLSDTKTLITTGGLVVIGTLALGWFMSQIHVFFPAYFSIPASFPYLDAFTTVMSFAATILMIYHRLESWMLWITVDVIGIGLYFAKDVKLVSLLYVIFLILATKGFIEWRKLWKRHAQSTDSPVSQRVLS